MANDAVMFNDILGNTLGVQNAAGFTPVAMTAFGETADASAFFTGKPNIPELGYAFLFRNYRAGQGKWQTVDPLGYPDGWNNLAYCNNRTWEAIDAIGASITYQWSDWKVHQIIGLNGYAASGYMYGYGVAITWEITVKWTCSACQKTGTETFYDATRISSPDVVWAAPSSVLGLSIPTAATLPGLVGELCASLLNE